MNTLYETLQNLGYGHPLHPLLVPLPLGGLAAALIFALLAAFSRRGDFAVSARHSSVLAFWAVFPTMALGYLDWQVLHGGGWSHAITMKVILASVLVVVLVVILLAQYLFGGGLKLLLPLYILAFVNVAAIGYYGGEIVFGGSATRQTAETERPPASAGQQGQVSYADIAAIFERHCTMCHSQPSPAGGLRLDSRAGVMAGGESGAVVVPGQPAKSELIRRLTGESQPAMPLRRPMLADQTVATVKRWIEQGAAAR